MPSKYWIIPGAYADEETAPLHLGLELEYRLVDVSTSEHALYAKNRMLKLDGTGRELKLDKNLFKPVAERVLAAAAKRGAAPDALLWLRQGLDPRLYSMKHWGWIRTRDADLYVWKWRPKTFLLLCNAKEFWAKQTYSPGLHAATIHEVSIDRSWVMPLEAFC